MPARADIIVSGDYDGDWMLVVEVKLHAHVARAEEQLRRYLQGYNCPLGLLVTASEIRVLKESYGTAGPDSIETVAVHPLPEHLRREARTPVAFEEAVQAWLERLAEAGTVIVDDQALAATLDAHVVPILRAGNIRAGRPRWNREAVAK